MAYRPTLTANPDGKPRASDLPVSDNGEEITVRRRFDRRLTLLHTA